MIARQAKIVHDLSQMSQIQLETNAWFSICDPREKALAIESIVGKGLSLAGRVPVESIGRNVKVVGVREVGEKPPLATREGQARLLHDLANIELQAMELATRSLFEFPEAPAAFRKELAELAIGEARHLRMCLDGLNDLGFEWGHWNVHLALWDSVSLEDTLLNRILIVHRYLEGAGLDAGDSILRRLGGVHAPHAKDIVSLIVREEVDHVAFGTRWYRNIAELNRIDPEQDFASRIRDICLKTPKRERISRELRSRAGFTEFEIDILEKARSGREIRGIA